MPKGRRKTLKGPRAWRKIDISDITDGARQKTDDMLAGGAIAEKPSSALFTVEKKKAPRLAHPLDPEARKARARAKSLHVDDAVKPNPHTKAEGSGTTAPETERLRKKRKFENMVKEVQDGRRELPKPVDSRSELAGKMRSRKVKPDGEDTGVKKTADGVFDLWDERAEELQKHKAFVDYFGFEEDFWQPTAKKPKLYDEEKSSAATKPSGRKAIEIAHSGSSYNPEYEAHQELLQQALDFHTKKADRRQVLARRMPKTTRSIDPLIFESEGESSEGEQMEVDGEEEKPKENLAHIPRKTKQDRQKEKARLRHERTLAAIAARKQANREFQKFGQMLEQMDEEARIKKAKKEAQKELEEQRAATRIIQTGPAHYTHAEPEVLFTDEITGSFRTLKPKTSVLQDRFASFQRRNFIDVRHKSTKREPERKTFTRYAFRDDAPM